MATIARVLYDVVARDGASGTFRRMGDNAGYAEAKVGHLGRAMAVAGGLAVTAAVAVGVESVRMATSFQSSMTKISTQAGGTAKDVHVLGDEVLRLASSHAEQGPQQLADALYHLKSLGMDNVMAMKSLRNASDLAAVGSSDLEQTTSALGAAWRSGIKGAGTFGQAASTVNAIIGAGNMKMGDLISALGTGILPSARTFGISLKSVGSALALMTDEGIPAVDAATRLRMTISLMGAPSKKATDALASIGLSSTALANKMRSPAGLVGAVALLKQHLDASGESATQQAQTLSHAFGGGRSSSAIMTLVNNLGTLQNKQVQINNTMGRYGAAVAAQRKTAGAEFDRLRAIVDAAGIRIGLALLPPVTGFVSFIVNRAVPAVASFGHRVAAVFDAVIPVGAIKRDWDSLMQFLGLAKPKPVKLFAGDLLHMPRPMPMSTADLIHPVPQKLYAGDLIHPLPKGAGDQIAGPIKSAITSAFTGSNFGMALGHALGTAMGWVSQHSVVFVGNLVKALGDLDWVNIGKMVGAHTVGFAIGLLSTFASDLFSPSFWMHHWWDVIIAALSLIGVGEIAGPITRVLEHIPILKMFAPLLRGIEKIGKPIGDAIGKALTWLGRGFMTGFRAAFPELERGLDDIYVHVGVWGLDLLKAATHAGEGLVSGVWRGAVGIGRVAGTIIKRFMTPFFTSGRWLISHGAEAIRGFIGGISNEARPLISFVGRVIGRVRGAFSGAGRWLLSAGRAVVDGLLSGIVDVAKGIGGWIKSHLIDPIINAVKGFFGIHSPSTVMAEIGHHLMGGLFGAIMSHDPLAVVRKVFGSMPAALGAIVEKGLVSVLKLPGRALAALEGLGGTVLSKIAGFFGGGTGLAMDAVLSAALHIAGAPSSWLRGLERVMSLESGGNPNAVNPVAVLGQHASGLMQMLPSTFASWAMRGLGGIFNPLANAVASIRYIRAEYGSPYGIPGLFSGSYRGYWQGGQITEPIFGIGKSGRRYSFGEGGLDEWVTRGRPGGQGVNGGLTGKALVNVEQMIVQDATDADLVAKKLAFRVMAASPGGNG